MCSPDSHHRCIAAACKEWPNDQQAPLASAQRSQQGQSCRLSNMSTISRQCRQEGSTEGQHGPPQ